MIVSLGIGRDASRELRDRLCIDAATAERLLTSKPAMLDELVVVSTCLRTELFATSTHPFTDVLHTLAGLLPGLRPEDHAAIRSRRDREAVEYLLRVACGLESIAIGEREILTQLRQAHIRAQAAGTSGPTLTTLFSRALRLGRQARRTTPLAGELRSLGTVTADAVRARIGPLTDRHILVLGAGAAARDVVRVLASEGASLTVLSRAAASAARVAERVGATSGTLDELPHALRPAEVVIAAIAGGIALPGSALDPSDPPALLLDLSVPRAVDPALGRVVPLLTLDELRSAPGDPHAVAAVHALIDQEADRFATRIDGTGRAQLVRTLRERAAAIADAEARRLLARSDPRDVAPEAVAAMARRIANKLIHAPTVALRDGDGTVERTLRVVYRLDERTEQR